MSFHVPSPAEEWTEVSNGFLWKWDYPFCIGALDGKHSAIQKPASSYLTILFTKAFSVL